MLAPDTIYHPDLPRLLCTVCSVLIVQWLVSPVAAAVEAIVVAAVVAVVVVAASFHNVVTAIRDNET